MPSQFIKLGIQFHYPENWTLDEDAALAGCQSVTVSSPGGAFWTVSIHPPTINPGELARVAVEAMREEYKDLESEAVSETIAGHDLIGHDLNFYYLDLTNTAGIRVVQGRSAIYCVFYQAEDREYAHAKGVFLAMTTSMLQNIPQPSHEH